MFQRKFNALASLALLATPPLIAQAEITRISDTGLSAVSGQLSIVYDNQKTVSPSLDLTLPDASLVRMSNAAPTGNGAPAPTHNPNPLLLPFSIPLAVLGGFNSTVLANAGGLGAETANILFAPLYRPLSLAEQGVNTALDYVFFPISAPLDVASQTFDTIHSTVVDTATQVLTAPLNAVFGPIIRAVDSVTGRAQATVDGVAYAITEVNGPRISNAFAGASQAASANGLDFNALVFARIAQAQAGRTAMRLDTLAARNGY
jgi:hypothetical protein